MDHVYGCLISTVSNTGQSVLFQCRCSHQIVLIAFDRRILRSAVSKDSPSTSAVAPKIRSAGSFGYAAGRLMARAQALPLIGRTMNRDFTFRKKDSRRIRPLGANSDRVISAIANQSLFLRSTLIAALALQRSYLDRMPARPQFAYRNDESSPVFWLGSLLRCIRSDKVAESRPGSH